jgi:AcrR family transcriptional regulator
VSVQAREKAQRAGGESRRGDLLEAMIEVAGTKGYSAVSVADVITIAGSSRTTFYKHFNDRHECFVAAYEIAVERVVSTVEAACDDDRRRPWASRARAGLVAAVELLAAEPELARTVVVEAAAGGAATRQRQMDALRRLARMLDRDRDAGRDDLPASTALMAVSAVNGLLFEEIRSGRAAQLADRLPDLLFALLVPFLGPREALRRLHRPAQPAS